MAHFTLPVDAIGGPLITVYVAVTLCILIYNGTTSTFSLAF